MRYGNDFGANTVWEYRNMPAVAKKLEPPGKHDACYLPRRIHVTRDIDIHELARDIDDELWMINTRFCCLARSTPTTVFIRAGARHSSALSPRKIGAT